MVPDKGNEPVVELVEEWVTLHHAESGIEHVCPVVVEPAHLLYAALDSLHFPVILARVEDFIHGIPFLLLNSVGSDGEATRLHEVGNYLLLHLPVVSLRLATVDDEQYQFHCQPFRPFF